MRGGVGRFAASAALKVSKLLPAKCLRTSREAGIGQGPDRQYPPMLDEDVFIDGEGMAHLFRFDRGDVSYRSRWVRTARYIAQERARRSLFGRYRNRYSDAPEAAGIHGGAANTHMIYHAVAFSF